MKYTISGTHGEKKSYLSWHVGSTVRPVGLTPRSHRGRAENWFVMVLKS
jgi:hypothetical protein